MIHVKLKEFELQNGIFIKLKIYTRDYWFLILGISKNLNQTNIKKSID